MSQPTRPRRLKFADNLFDRFTRSTHFHPDFTFSRTARFLSWKLILWTIAVCIVVFYGVVAIADVAIYKKDVDNHFTQLMDRVFPFPAAVSGGQVITLSRFRKEVDARIVYSQTHKLGTSKQAIENLVAGQLVDKALYSQAAATYSITITSADVDTSMQGIYSQVGGQGKLNSFILSNYGSGISLTDFRQWVQESLTESAIEHQVLQHAEVSHILIAVPANATADQVEAARQKALSIKAKITDQASFEAMAKQYSEDISSRDNGGSLGTTVRGDDAPVISADFQNAVFTLPIGQVSDPVRSSYGWHLILITSRSGSVDESMKQYTADLETTHHPKAFLGNWKPA